MKTIGLVIFLIFYQVAFGQVGISPSSSPADNSAMLDVKSTNKGLLLPRMKLADRNTITNPASSLLIYQNDVNPGFYYNNGSPSSPNWRALVSASNPYGNKIPIDTLPFIISAPGSYIVVKKLSGLTGIVINSSDVNIDLNFNSINGSVGNTSSGVNVSAAYSRISIYNGSLSDWSGDGINGANATKARYMHITTSDNGGDGIISGDNSIISSCISTENGFNGFDVGKNSIVENSIAQLNTISGINSNSNSTILVCTSSNNVGNGIRTINNCVISQSSSNMNGGHGMLTGINNNVIGNTCGENTLSGFYLGNGSYAENNSSRQNSRHGYECNQDVTCINNSADSNTKNGFDTTLNGGKWEGNNSTDNEYGYSAIGTGWLVIKNTASGNSVSAFAIGGSNMAGTIVTSSALLNANTNPNINISY